MNCFKFMRKHGKRGRDWSHRSIWAVTLWSDEYGSIALIRWHDQSNEIHWSTTDRCGGDLAINPCDTPEQALEPALDLIIGRGDHATLLKGRSQLLKSC